MKKRKSNVKLAGGEGSTKVTEIASSSSRTKDNDGRKGKQVINVDFEFFDPKPVDFHGLKGLLRTYLDETAWDLTSLVDTIIAQTTVGTVVKTGDDESPIGVASALNLHRHKAWAKDVAGFLRANAGQRPEATKLEALLAAVQQKKRQVGLIVSERVVNLPVELTPPLHQALFDEILWATEDEA
eukprot:jgi/Mesen1/869/ME000114S10947